MMCCNTGFLLSKADTSTACDGSFMLSVGGTLSGESSVGYLSGRWIQTGLTHKNQKSYDKGCVSKGVTQARTSHTTTASRSKWARCMCSRINNDSTDPVKSFICPAQDTKPTDGRGVWSAPRAREPAGVTLHAMHRRLNRRFRHSMAVSRKVETPSAYYVL